MFEMLFDRTARTVQGVGSRFGDSGNAGSVSSIMVKPFIGVFIAVPSTINKGENAILTWQSIGADTITLTDFGNVTSSGARTVSPSSTKTYTLTATNSDGTTTKSRTITVIQPLLPSASFQESSANVGDTIHADFSWLNGVVDPVSGYVADYYIIDPSGNAVVYGTSSNVDGSDMLYYVADQAGVWKAEIYIWDGSTYLTSVDTVPVSTTGVTSGSANFQESSADVGDTIHADFSWLNAMFNLPDGFAHMVIQDPDGNNCSGYIDVTHSAGSHTLSCTTDKIGTWTARISVWNGFMWIEATDTVPVSTPGEGEADIVDVEAPDVFEPDVQFVMCVTVENTGSFADNLFVKLTNVDTGEVLQDMATTTPIEPGNTIEQMIFVTLSQVTDFHGLVEGGHLE